MNRPSWICKIVQFDLFFSTQRVSWYRFTSLLSCNHAQDWYIKGTDVRDNVQKRFRNEKWAWHWAVIWERSQKRSESWEVRWHLAWNYFHCYYVISVILYGQDVWNTKSTHWNKLTDPWKKWLFKIKYFFLISIFMIGKKIVTNENGLLCVCDVFIEHRWTLNEIMTLCGQVTSLCLLQYWPHHSQTSYSITMTS